MFDHFGLEDQAEKLTNEGVQIKHLFSFAKKFSVGESEAEFSKINLYFYVDKYGDPFEVNPKFAHNKIFMAMFENLPIEDKLSIGEYIAEMEEE